jgi:hypothetical protein
MGLGAMKLESPPEKPSPACLERRIGAQSQLRSLKKHDLGLCPRPLDIPFLFASVLSH